MAKSKVKEIKKKIKVTEIIKDDFSLENKVTSEPAPSQMFNPSRSVNPTLAQSTAPMFTRQTQEQVREELRNKDKEFSYISTVRASANTTRSYDPSIKSGSAFFEAQSSTGRINPTIKSNTLQQQNPRTGRIMDTLNQGDIEPGLRKFDSQEKDYRTERVEKYVPKRRNDN